jgi:hypothetical protein
VVKETAERRGKSVGRTRTDGFVLIRVVAGEERPLAAKQAFFKSAVANLGSRPFDPPHLRQEGL